MDKKDFLQYNDETGIDGLIQALCSGEAVLFVGAGCSCRLGFPSWKELLRKLVKNHGELAIDEEKLKSDIILYAQEIKDAYYAKYKKFDQYENFLTRSFQKPNDGFKNTELHELLAKFPVKSFITTNYDKAIEYFLSKNAEPLEGIDFVNQAMLGKFLFKHKDAVLRQEVLHLHGTYNFPSRIILTKKDYEKAYEDKIEPILDEDEEHIKIRKPLILSRPLEKSVLWTLLSTRQVIFIGFSLEDAYFIKMLSSVCNDLWDFGQSKHFVLLPFNKNAPSDGDQKDIFRKEDHFCWVRGVKFNEDYGVQAVFYPNNDDPDHMGLLELTKYLLSATKGQSLLDEQHASNEREATTVETLLREASGSATENNPLLDWSKKIASKDRMKP